MNVDTELEIWSEQWKSQAAEPGNFGLRVARQTRVMKLMVALDVLVTILIGGGSTVWALLSPEPDIVVLAIICWLLLGVAWSVRIKITRGRWAPSALNTAAFVELLIARCRGQLTAAKFGAGLFVFNTLFGLTWVYQHAPEKNGPLASWLLFSSIPIDCVWLSTVLFFAGLFWYVGKKKAELSNLLEIQRQLSQHSTTFTASPARDVSL